MNNKNLNTKKDIMGFIGMHSKLRLSGIGLVLLLMISASVNAFYTPDWRYKNGTVLARAVVLDPDTNQPILVKYNLDGTEAGEVNVPGQYANSIDELIVMPAADYRYHKQRYDEFMEEHQNDLAQGAELMSRQEFLQTTFLAADNATPIPVSEPRMGVNSVLVRGQSNRILPDPSQLVLLTFPIDLTQNIQVTDNDLSLLVTPEGAVIERSALNIGYRTGFFGNPEEPQDVTEYRIDHDEDTIFGPVASVTVNVDTSLYPGGASITDSDGRYGFMYLLPICPIGGHSFITDVWVELRYRNFMPIGSPTIPYYLRQQSWDSCYASLLPPIGLYHNTPASTLPIIQHNLYVDVMFLTGRIGLKNIRNEEVEIGPTTTFTAFEGEANVRAQQYYDFNGDGQPDTVILGSLKMITNTSGETVEAFVPESQFTDPEEEPELQGIFFDGVQNNPEEMPDILRLVDRDVRVNEPVGVLATISQDDLRNTDILFFRESTGQLVMERRGLKEAEAERRQATQFDEDENEVAYRVMLRGPRDSILNIGGGTYSTRLAGWQDWAEENMLTEPFHERTADHLRPGEFVKIVAINRATGYTGTARARLSSISENYAGLLSVEVPPITMVPPNLKIWAERTYDVEHGLTAGEEREYVIGSEGAALTSDAKIVIYTEWLDENGNPLPAELGLDDGEQYGLTGRFAKVVAENQLGSAGVNSNNGTDLAEFPIAPGRNTQVVNVGSNLTTAEHYYIHVHGMAKDQECVSGYTCPDFDVPGSAVGATAPYDSRPSLLTPFLVPLFNEDRHWQEYTSYRELQRDYDPASPNGEEPTKPLPAYSWQFRPEYQFSQFELEMQEINRTFISESGAEDTVNILNDDRPIVEPSDEAIVLFYSLLNSNFERLSPVDGVQELVLSVGEEEQMISFGEDQTIRFENVGHLAELAPEDFLSMRLYTNNDAGNVLWEYAFANETYAVSERSEVTVDTIAQGGFKFNTFLFGEDGDNTHDIGSVSLRWSISSGGSLSNTATTSNIGAHVNDIFVSPVAGTVHTVTARVVASEHPSYSVGSVKTWGPFVSTAGEPYRVDITSSNGSSLPADGVSTTTLTATIYDRYDNLVRDETEVSWTLPDTGEFLEQDFRTVDGVAQAVYQTGTAMGDSTVSVAATGNSDVETEEVSVTSTFTINKTPVNVSLSASSTSVPMDSTDDIQLVANVTGTENADSLVAYWYTSNSQQPLAKTPVIGEQAMLTIYAPGYPTTDTVTVNVVGVKESLDITYTPTGQSYAELATQTIVAGSGSGVVEIESLGGSEFMNYHTDTTLTLHGTPGEQITLTPGGIFTPNATPSLSFDMNGIGVNSAGDRVLVDSVNDIEGQLMGDITHALNQGWEYGGTSLEFSSGNILVAANPDLSFIDDLFVNVRFVPTTETNEQILIRTSAYELKIVNTITEGLSLVASVTTQNGIYQATVAEDIFFDEWNVAGLKFQNGYLVVGLNNARNAVEAPGVLQYSSQTISIGSNFVGFMDQLHIGQENAANSLISVSENSLTFDSTGTAQVSVSATGNEIAFARMVGFSVAPMGGSVAQSYEINIRDTKEQAFLARTLPPIELFVADSAEAQPGTERKRRRDMKRIESGVSVVNRSVWGGFLRAFNLELLGSVIDATRATAKFLYSLTTVHDIQVIIDAIWAAFNGDWESVDGFELTFAVVSVTVTVVVTIATGGVGAIASITAMQALKGLLKWVYQESIGLLLDIGKWIGKRALEVISNPRGAGGAALNTLRHLANSFTALVQNSVVGVRDTFRQIKSIDDFDTWVKTYGNDEFASLCLRVTLVERENPYLIASDMERMMQRITPVSLFIEGANAQVCGLSVLQKLGQIASSGNDGALVAMRIATLANKHTDTFNQLTSEALDGIAAAVRYRVGVSNTREAIRLLDERLEFIYNNASPLEVSEVFSAINTLALRNQNGLLLRFNSVLGDVTGKALNRLGGMIHTLRDLSHQGWLDSVSEFELPQSMKTALTTLDNADVEVVDDLGDALRKVDAVVEVAPGVIKRVEYKRWTNDISWPKPFKKMVDVIQNGVVIGKEARYGGEQFEFFKDLVVNANNPGTIDFVWRLSPGPNDAANAEKLARKMLAFVGESNSGMNELLKAHLLALRRLETADALAEVERLQTVINNVRTQLKADLSQSGGVGGIIQISTY